MATNDLLIGLVAVGFCVLLFGIFTLPTKTTRTGDGILFQWFMCTGIFFIGMITHFVQCMTTSNEGFLTNSTVSSSSSSCPQFIPFSAIGGAIWCLSNVLLVPLVNCIGIGLCMMIWGMAEMLIGWLTGRLGLFGVNQEPVTDVNLNSIGVALALLSLLVLSMAQSSVADGSDKAKDDDGTTTTKDTIESFINGKTTNHTTMEDPLLYSSRFSVFTDNNMDDDDNEEEEEDDDEHVIVSVNPSKQPPSILSFSINNKNDTNKNIRKLSRENDQSSSSSSSSPTIDNDRNNTNKKNDNLSHFDEHGWDITVYFTPAQKRIIGIVGSLFAGLLSGSTFTPAQHVVDSMINWRNSHAASTDPSSGPYPGASIILIDHIYSHFTGIFITSTAVVILYCIGTRNRPWVHSNLVFPSIVAGLTWGLAMVSWFIANEKLSIVISFPLVTLGPGIVNMIIGTVVYKEVQGKRNILLLILSTFIYICAAVMISLSGPSSS